ncbi:hypothetical protein [Evansella cellulosilytica]|uniref:Thioredoxin n=1 Tax=Evansella cellulosilytica (strain ATCC 21833 / DSM 2522 / FERM P-1141 / JCM 9156 / N-4) TaxID=649639 RepID=E6TT62_EVAC2|nr:hypothetical protein [Evansella cellulosilytica]ADU31970.1 hypothetical protein Bcell_3730 [Evansella cellulosilytica DSM 2522]
MSKRKKKTIAEKGKNKRNTIILSCLGLVLAASLLSYVVNADSSQTIVEEYEVPEKLQKYELSGTVDEVRAELIKLMANEMGEFIYIYEPGCDECDRMDAIVFPIAESEGITVNRLNIKKYEELAPLVDLDNIPTPVTVYYSGGWREGWITGNEDEKYYHDFIDHFYLHHEKHPDGNTVH